MQFYVLTGGKRVGPIESRQSDEIERGSQLKVRLALSVCLFFSPFVMLAANYTVSSHLSLLAANKICSQIVEQ